MKGIDCALDIHVWNGISERESIRSKLRRGAWCISWREDPIPTCLVTLIRLILLVATAITIKEITSVLGSVLQCPAKSRLVTIITGFALRYQELQCEVGSPLNVEFATHLDLSFYLFPWKSCFGICWHVNPGIPPHIDRSYALRRRYIIPVPPPGRSAVPHPQLPN